MVAASTALILRALDLVSFGYAISQSMRRRLRKPIKSQIT